MLSTNQERLIAIGKLWTYNGELCCMCDCDLDTDETDPIYRRIAGLKDWHWIKGKYYCQDCYDKLKEQKTAEC